jgi:hypothetical protein
MWTLYEKVCPSNPFKDAYAGQRLFCKSRGLGLIMLHVEHLLRPHISAK